MVQFNLRYCPLCHYPMTEQCEWDGAGLPWTMFRCVKIGCGYGYKKS